MPSVDNSSDARIDEFIARSRLLNGQKIVERPAWNTCATPDAIRHFAYGTSDGNPLWLDDRYALATPHRGLLAPPAFLCSVLYPFLHGAPIQVPLSSLIGGIAMEWLCPIREGDRLRASARQLDVTESLDRRGRRLVLIDAETRYWNQRDEVVGIARGTMVRVARPDAELLLDREIHRYDEAQRARIQQALLAEARSGPDGRVGSEVWVGQPLPVRVRGPLAIGDLICWQAAIGPSYRAGALGYLDTLQSPHTVAINPMTGWPLKYSQQHEDFLMARQRGMPAPFDNSLMRFAWIAPMLTDWMGDDGVLRRLNIQTGAPILYGDTTWYRGIVTGKKPAEERDGVAVTIRISGINQLGETTTSGEAEVILPARRQGTRPRSAQVSAEPAPVPLFLDLLRAQVQAQPDAVAVECGDKAMTFAQLDARAERLARRLAGITGGQCVPVALMLERNLDAIVAIVATLKAGCCYLPLDPRLPLERLNGIIDCASPAIVLVPEKRLSAISTSVRPADDRQAPRHALHCLEALCGDDDADLATETFSSSAGDLAYIMQTSGTMASPRLAAVGHAALGRYLLALRERLDVTGQDVYLHTAAFNFSASVRQLFLPLSVGARLVIAQDEQRLDLLALWQLMGRRGVTVWDTIPSVWRACIENFLLLDKTARAALLDNGPRLILTTGEPLAWSIPRRWRVELGNRARIANLYSQTETAGTVCLYEVPDEIPNADGCVPLGSPLRFTSVDLLDSDGKPVPPGGVGEICVGGSRLASGYVGQGALTAERFVLWPFEHDGYYRTGDLGRCDEHGVLEFVGRRDHRVKIRGQGVDLAEIENALRTLPGVDDAVAAVVENAQGRSRLVAYLASTARSAPQSDVARAQLRTSLPDAALPEVFVLLERLPRNAAGKVDRTALPLPTQSDAIDAVEPPKSPNPLADGIERIFAEALELRQVGHDDDFFDLGGNSLMATVVITRLRIAFGVPLTMLRFFEKPTVAALATAIEGLLLNEVESLSEADALRLLDEDARQ